MNNENKKTALESAIAKSTIRAIIFGLIVVIVLFIQVLYLTNSSFFEDALNLKPYSPEELTKALVDSSEAIAEKTNNLAGVDEISDHLNKLIEYLSKPDKSPFNSTYLINLRAALYESSNGSIELSNLI